MYYKNFLILDVCLSLIGVIDQENVIKFVFPRAWILLKPSPPNYKECDLLYLKPIETVSSWFFPCYLGKQNNQITELSEGKQIFFFKPGLTS